MREICAGVCGNVIRFRPKRATLQVINQVMESWL